MLQNFCVGHSMTAAQTALTARERNIAAPMKTLNVGYGLVEDGMMAVPLYESFLQNFGNVDLGLTTFYDIIDV